MDRGRRVGSPSENATCSSSTTASLGRRHRRGKKRLKKPASKRPWAETRGNDRRYKVSCNQAQHLRRKRRHRLPTKSPSTDFDFEFSKVEANLLDCVVRNLLLSLSIKWAQGIQTAQILPYQRLRRRRLEESCFFAAKMAISTAQALLKLNGTSNLTCPSKRLTTSGPTALRRRSTSVASASH